MRRNLLASLSCLWAATTLILGGCPAPAPAPVAPRPIALAGDVAAPDAPTVRPAIAIDPQAGPNGKLTIQRASPTAGLAQATATVLSAAETTTLLARLAPLPEVDGRAPCPAISTAEGRCGSIDRRHPPVMRPPSAAPAPLGTIEPIAFVTPTGAIVADKPLATSSVVPISLAPPQILPAGELGRAESELHIRFDEPMVAVAAVGEAKTPVATITPNVEGTWRWIDTRVAGFFILAPRLAMATQFTVTVPAGTRAVSGATLASPVSETLSTPPVEILDRFPSHDIRPDAPIAIRFDQHVDREAVAKFLQVESVGGRRLAWKTLTLAEAEPLWARNPSVRVDEQQLGEDYVIVAPITAWSAGSVVRILLGEGTPSREGPRVTSRLGAIDVKVAPPLTVTDMSCDDQEQPLTKLRCPASSTLVIRFSNPIEHVAHRSSKVRLDGNPIADSNSYGSIVEVPVPDEVGRAAGITIDDGLIDELGQPLSGARQFSFRTIRERIDPSLEAARGLFILDPRFEIPQWTITTKAVPSLRVELYAVKPADYFAFQAFERGARATPPGKLVFAQTYSVGARFMGNASIDLRPALGATGTGHVIAVASVPASLAGTRGADRSRQLERADATIRAWIEVTKLGVVARVDRDRVSSWVENIAPDHLLAPIAGATASLLVEGRTDMPAPATTDAAGHAVFDLPEASPKPTRRTAVLVVESGADSVFATIDRDEQAVRVHDAYWYVTDDRFTYKPGESVEVKGWVRWRRDGADPALELPAKTDDVAYTLLDSRGTKLASGTAHLTSQGGFDLEASIPANAALGTARFELESGHATYEHPIELAEFRTPAFAVTLDDDVQYAGARPVVLGETIEMNAAAKYYGGGGLAGAYVRWSGTLSAVRYQPPGWDRFSFTPAHARSDDGRPYLSANAQQDATLSGSSSSSVAFGIPALPGAGPSVLEVDAAVTDVDRATIRSSSRSILVHPSSYYVGLRAQPETLDSLELVVTDIDGHAVSGVPVDVTIEGVLAAETYHDDAKVIDTQHCAVTSASAPVRCHWTPGDAQTSYRAVARIADARGRTNVAQYELPRAPTTAYTPSLSIVPDRASYRPGQIAKLTIHSSMTPATAVVSFVRRGLIAQQRVELSTEATVVELPIARSYVQNVHVLVDRSARVHDRDSTSTLQIPQHTTAELDLPIELDSARLVMTTRSTERVVRPGGDATFEVEVAHDGEPVDGAEVALIVVDEAVLALSTRTYGDPLLPFYPEVADGTAGVSTIDLVADDGNALDRTPGYERFDLDASTRPGYVVTSRYGGMRGRTAAVPSVMLGQAAQAKLRKDFRATAVFSPRLRTDANGKVTLTVKMPDALTRYRVLALATASTGLFGKAESTIATQRTINARTVAPRFLTQGDAFALPVVVQNLDTVSRTIDVAVRASNLAITGPAGKRVTVAAGQRAELRFELATQARGRAVIQTIASASGSSSDLADSSEVELPVYEPATTETFATYGVVDDAPRFERLAVPSDVFTEVGGVDTELASTQLQSLTDAYWYLYAYPYECAEQRSSRMLATAAMADILDAFVTPGRPTRQMLDAQRATDLDKLTRDQNRDGGWGYWHDTSSDPFVTAQVLTALVAQHVQSEAVKRASAFVGAQVAARLGALDATARRPVLDRKPEQLAYTIALASSELAALAAAGIDERANAQRLHTTASKLAVYPIDAKARLLALVAKLGRAKAMRAALLGELLSATRETAASATVATSYTEAERVLLVSNAKTTALALDAIIREAPEHAVIPKLARGLLDARRQGRWRSTQENLAVLQAMRRYFDAYEKDTPSYTGKVWVGNAAYAEQAFAGRSNVHGVSHLDWSALAPGSTHDIALQKTGTGRMYYRVGITYAPRRAELPALDVGFIVRRAYRAVEDPGDVVRTADGHWKIKLGAKLEVVLEEVNTSPRVGVALVDPLPAGFEPVNTRLAHAERTADDSTVGPTWDHIDLRDNRSEAFATELRAGTHRFVYTVRATTPGTFLAAPAKAEEMYSPETFGRSAGTTVTVE